MQITREMHSLVSSPSIHIMKIFLRAKRMYLYILQWFFISGQTKYKDMIILLLSNAQSLVVTFTVSRNPTTLTQSLNHVVSFFLFIYLYFFSILR